MKADLLQLTGPDTRLERLGNHRVKEHCTFSIRSICSSVKQYYNILKWDEHWYRKVYIG